MDTILKVDVGSLEEVLISCDLSQASAPVKTYNSEEYRWEPTQFQCADCRHDKEGLLEIAKILCGQWCECNPEEAISSHQWIENPSKQWCDEYDVQHHMYPYTHIITEDGNGLPSIGETVVCVDCHGNEESQKIKSASRIQTEQWKSNFIYVELEDSDLEPDEYMMQACEIE